MVHVFTRRAFVALALSSAACAWPATDAVSASSIAPATAPQTRLEVVRIDDAVDPLAQLATIPAGIDIDRETAPSGAQHHFALTRLQPGESQLAAFARLRAFLDTVPVPTGRRFGLEARFEPDGANAVPAGARSQLLVSDAVVRTEDVARTTLFESEQGDEAPVSIRVHLSPEAGARFERATAAWVGRRMAIVVDDEVLSAPVVRDPIRGGEIALTFGRDHSRADVERIARLLQPK